MIGEQLDIQGKLKPVERRLGTLKKHLEQADIYFKCKGKKPLTEAEQILFTTAKDYLKGVMNGKTTIPTKAWKEEYTKLTAERKTLNQRYLALKEEVKEAEKIRKSVYSILRQEQREPQTVREKSVNFYCILLATILIPISRSEIGLIILFYPAWNPLSPALSR